MKDAIAGALDSLPILDRIRIRNLSSLEKFALRQLRRGRLLSLDAQFRTDFSEPDEYEHECMREDWIVDATLSSDRRIVKVSESQHFRRKQHGFLEMFLAGDGNGVAAYMGIHPVQSQADKEIWARAGAKVVGMMTRLEGATSQANQFRGSLTNNWDKVIYTVPAQNTLSS